MEASDIQRLVHSSGRTINIGDEERECGLSAREAVAQFLIIAVPLAILSLVNRRSVR